MVAADDVCPDLGGCTLTALGDDPDVSGEDGVVADSTPEDLITGPQVESGAARSFDGGVGLSTPLAPGSPA